MPVFRALLKDLITRYGGNKKDFAQALGITQSTLSHWIRTVGVFPSVEMCLRLATITGENASKILRAAEKGEIADVLEDQYGAPRKHVTGHAVTATPREQAHLITLRSLGKRNRRTVLDITESLARAEKATRHTSHPLKPAAER